MKSKMVLSLNLRLLIGFLRFGLALVCVVALGGQLPGPVRADVSLNIGIMDLSGLDPALTTDGAAHEVTNQIYETLVTLDPGGTLPKAGVAQSWSASTDGLTWTFTLRAGLKFHDGTDLDAAAVAANF